jgi:hypothetical protein
MKLFAGLTLALLRDTLKGSPGALSWSGAMSFAAVMDRRSVSAEPSGDIAGAFCVAKPPAAQQHEQFEKLDLPPPWAKYVAERLL